MESVFAGRRLPCRVSSDDGTGEVADDPTVAALARDLRAAARRDDQRRLLVIAGDDDERVDAAARDALAAADLSLVNTAVVGDRRVLDAQRHAPEHARELLGTTRQAVVFDARDRLVPNALGSVVGAVDGGGLLVLLTPPLEHWPDHTDEFDASLAAPPHDPGEVTGRFRRRFVDTLREHSGVAVYDAHADRVRDDGATDQDHPAVPDREFDPVPPANARFPAPVYRATRTRDQHDAVAVLEAVAPSPLEGENGDQVDAPGPRAAVVEADRGRGKSSAAGLAVGAVVAAGGEVVVTAPDRANAREVLARGREAVDALDADAHAGDGPGETEGPDPLRSASGGSLQYRSPAEAVDSAAEADLLVVDEAAAIPVDRLAETLDADRVVYATTVHGYEGTGRGFAVRFRDRLTDAAHEVHEIRMDEPVRYAPGDPVERWAFDALLLDARPPVTPAVTDATAETVAYRQVDRDALVADPARLREVVGLLARAHYRTEPNDLARLLDAPNVTVRTLVTAPDDGREHVVSVALLAREGGLSAERRARMYEGERVRGHMVPDVLTSQLRDPDAGDPVGLRVLRIATHHAVRSRGLGSRLLDAVRGEFGPGDASDTEATVDRDSPGAPATVDYLGVGFGATPRLLSFWTSNGFRTVHLSLSRNDRSGEHSAVMIAGLTAAGLDLETRHVEWFRERTVSAASGPLSTVDPDVVRAALRATAGAGDPPVPDLDDREWRLVAGAAYGPGLYQVRPAPFRELAVAGIVDPDAGLSPGEERLLVGVVLQGRPVEAVADALDYHSAGECLRAVGAAVGTLADRYGGRVVSAERDRYD